MSELTDLTFLQGFTNGDTDKMSKYIQMFLDKAPEMVNKMNTFYNEKKYEELKVVAHSLKPQLGYMGVKSLEQDMKLIEDYAGNEVNLEELPELLKKVESGCAQVFGELKTHLSSF